MQKRSPGPTREAHPITPLQVERLALDLDMCGYEMSAVLVRLMAYAGLRPQETRSSRTIARTTGRRR